MYPYMAYELIREHFRGSDWPEKMSNYRYALEKGLLKIMSKMGISTISSYHGSMLMHSLCLGPKISKTYFPSIPSQLGGIELEHVHAHRQRKELEKISEVDREDARKSCQQFLNSFLTVKRLLPSCQQ